MLMQNSFSKCREWVPRGTSQHKWRWLTTLLLILTLGIGQMWGADKSATTSLNLSNLTSSNWGSWSDGTPIISGDYFKISAYMGRTSSSQSWIGYTGGNNGDYNSGNGWSSTGKFAGSVALSATSKYMAMQPSRSMYFRVTGCEAVYALVQNTKSGNTYRRTTISAFEYTTSRAASASATMTSSDNSTTIEEISVTGLDAAKTYEILLAGTESSNAYLMELVFEKSSSTLDPSATPSITTQPATTAVNYIKDAAATALSVEASASAGTLTYQWYKNTTNSNASGTAIDGATSASYTPSTAEVGTLYYYCAVTNTESGKSATTVKSNVSGAITTQLNPVGTGHTLTWNLVVRTSSSGESTLETATTDIGTSSKSSSSSYLTTLTDLTGVGVKRTTDGKSNNTGKIETPSDYDKDKYVTMNFTVTDGYQFTPSAVSIKTVAVSTAKDLKFEFSDANGSYSVTKQNLSTSGTAATNELDFSSCDKAFTGTVTIKIYVYGAENQYRFSTPLVITGDVAAYVPVVGHVIEKSATNGTIETSVGGTAVTSANASAQVDIVANPSTGYEFTSWDIYKTGETSTKVTPNAATASTYFTMPDYNVTVSATFSAIDYTITKNAATNGSFTVKIGEDEVTKANIGQTITLAATPATGYVLYAWTVMNGETPVSVTNNQFTMPAGNVTVSATFAALPTVADLVEISDDWTYEPTATLTANTLYESSKIISLIDGNGYSSGKGGLQIKQNRPIAFKIADNARVTVTFTKNGSKTMEMGDALENEKYDTYASSDESPLIHTFTTGGVVYLTANDQLYMSKLEIQYPHTVTYALNGGDGTLLTESAHYVGDKFNLHNGEDGITAPTDKEFAGWNDGTTTYVGGAEYTMGASAVILTAQWATPLPEPTITFNDGNYTVAGAALDLSTLFSSNSDGAVTYTVKTAGETGAAIDGTNFSATAAGSAVVTATQAATASYKTKSVDATITISAPSEIDGIKLVEDGVLTGNFRTSASLKDQERTIKGITYSKYINLSSRSSWGSQPAGPDNYLLQYTLTKKTNTFYFYAYNKNSGSKSIKVYVKEEGENIVTKTIDIPAGKGDLLSCEVNVTKNAEVLISHTSTDVQICQVVVVESGDELLLAPAVNYNISFNKGRLTAKQNTAKTFEGMTYCNNADYKIDNSSNLKLTTRGTHYVSFEIPTGQTRKLQVTTGGSAYNVSKTLGDNTTATKTGNHDFNLGAGVWYINPQGSDVTITNLKFIAADAAITVTFNSNGGSDVDAQALFAGDVVTEPSPAPTKSGYRFVGWQKSGVDYDFSTELVEGDAPGFALDAVWQEVVVVTFNPNNGEDTFTKNADKGEVLAVGDRPADPERAGYVFQGWTRDAEAEPIVYVNLASETFSAAATLTAVWEVAQTDATISALSYNGNAINVASAEDVDGVATYTVHLQWGTAIDKDLISVTKTASSATVGTIAYDSEAKKATFTVTAGDGTTTADYAIQFVIDAKVGTSIVKAVISGGDQKAGFDATGIYGDKGYAYTRSNKKMDTADKFVGVKLLAGKTFEVSDKLFVVTSTPADQGYIEIYEEAEGTNLIKATGVRDASEGIVVPELEGYSEFYIVRKASTGDQAWNGFVDYVEVTREMNPAIKSFKFGDDAATINEGAKTITIEMPYSADVTALTPTVEAYGNNGATYTPSGATDFTSPVDYVVMDAYSELSTTYEVTVTKAPASENANLASLAVAGYSLDFDPATTTYNVVLDYGTTVLPTITYEVAEVGLATAEKVEGGVNGATTITVTPEAGAGYEKVYTINFSVSMNPKYVIYDGSTMTNIASATGVDGSTGFSYSLASNIPLSGDDISSSWGGKDYTYVIKGFKPNDNTNNIVSFVVPEGYVAKVRLVGTTNSTGTERQMFIAMNPSKNVADAISDYIITSSTYDAQGFITDYLLPNTYYLGSTDSYRLYEFSVTLYPIDKERTMTQGRFGTICYPNGGRLLGAMLLEIAYFDPDQKKIFFDEVVDGQMVAGAPYLFLPNEGVDKFAIVYTDNVNAPAGHHNGLYGSYTQEALPTDGNHYIMLNNQYCKVVEANTYVGANRAYILLNKIGNDYVAPSYGRRRVSMDVQGEQVATGMEGLNVGDQPIKLMINGQMYILRGDKMYDATGRLVK